MRRTTSKQLHSKREFWKPALIMKLFKLKRKGFHRTFVKDRVGKKSFVDRPNEVIPLESSRVATRQPEYVIGTASVESLGT